jgi:hypothetical protein
VRFAAFPDASRVAAALASAGLPLGSLEAAIRAFVCPDARRPGFGYQQSIADHLQSHLRSTLSTSGLRPVSTRVSPNLHEEADLALAPDGSGRAVYFEIEFRPNVEKDLIKFQIAHNRGGLATGVLMVANERQRINPAYTTMPEFDKVARILTELKPPFALLLVGIGGEHRD